ncbi:hypothetical protein RJ53_08510 [Methanocalculus chunghsingensis]|uniref:Uncharacterized protein n=1 Tax=Methanocalculus chunghsingensis TaxID=156457 RepID=A0A8J7WAB6_9EURY|nr:hypothetical protein [Methanocalculus chunghsingensis]
MPFLALKEPPLCFLSGSGMLDFMSQFRKLCLRVASLLNIEVGSFIKCLNDDLFPPSSGEDDEGGGISGCPQGREELDPGHPRHLVIGDDHIELAGPDEIQGITGIR